MAKSEFSEQIVALINSNYDTSSDWLMYVHECIDVLYTIGGIRDDVVELLSFNGAIDDVAKVVIAAFVSYYHVLYTCTGSDDGNNDASSSSRCSMNALATLRKYNCIHLILKLINMHVNQMDNASTDALLITLNTLVLLLDHIVAQSTTITTDGTCLSNAEWKDMSILLSILVHSTSIITLTHEHAITSTISEALLQHKQSHIQRHKDDSKDNAVGNVDDGDIVLSKLMNDASIEICKAFDVIESKHACILASPSTVVIAGKLLNGYSRSVTSDSLSSVVVLIAKNWDKSTDSCITDVHTIHTLYQILQYHRLHCNTMVSDSAIAVIIPIGLRLMNRLSTDNVCLGIYFIRYALDIATTSLLLSMASWLLPQLLVCCKSSNNALSVLFSSRLISSIITATASSSILLHYNHLYMNYLNEFSAPSPRDCYPYLISYDMYVKNCSSGILILQLNNIVDMISILINKWHLYIHVYCIDILSVCIDRCYDSIDSTLWSKILTEYLRPNAYDVSGSSKGMKKQLLSIVIGRINSYIEIDSSNGCIRSFFNDASISSISTLNNNSINELLRMSPLNGHKGFLFIEEDEYEKRVFNSNDSINQSYSSTKVDISVSTKTRDVGSNVNATIGKRSFICRYFMSFPLAGVKWFSKVPSETITVNECIENTSIGGWLYGGSIQAEFVQSEDKLIASDHTIQRSLNSMYDKRIDFLYPFSIKISCGKHKMMVRLACATEEERQLWEKEVKQAYNIYNYIQFCHENKTIPSMKIYTYMNDEPVNTLVCSELHTSYQLVASLIVSKKFTLFHSSYLHTVIISHMQLDDTAAPYIAAILATLVNLKTFSVAENFITCKCIKDISSQLSGCSSLTSFDVTGNLIGNDGAEMIALASTMLPLLSHLNLSRNLLTSKCIKTCTTHLTRHTSKLTDINLSYNQIGDGVAALIVLLMYFIPSIITHCDVSFCGITERGLKELATAISQCTSIISVNLRGNNFDNASMIALMNAVSKRSVYMRSKGVKVSLNIGGMLIGINPQILSYQSVNASLPYVSENSSLKELVLRKRSASTVTYPVGTTESVGSTDGTTLSIKFRLLHYMSCVEEFLTLLADILNVEYNCFLVLSTSIVDVSNRIYVVVFQLDSTYFTIHSNNHIMKYLSPKQVLTKSLKDIISTKEKIGIIYQKQNDRLGITSSTLIIEQLLLLVSSSDRVAKAAGILSLHVQYSNGKMRVEIIGYGRYTSKSKGGSASSSNSSSVSRKASSCNRYLPLLSPVSVPLNVDEDDDDAAYDAVTATAKAAALSSNDRDVCSKDAVAIALSVMSLINVDNYNRSIDTPKSASRSASVGSNDTHKVDIINDFNAMERSVDVQKRKKVNKRYAQALRSLHTSQKMSTRVCQFWEGAFGNIHYKKMYNKVLMSVVDDEGIYVSVGQRKLLCDAMFNRDKKAIEEGIGNINDTNCKAYECSKKILANILNIGFIATIISHMPTDQLELQVAEGFLLLCAKVGYSGQEMYPIVETRQSMLQRMIDTGSASKTELDNIKYNALLTNLMLSRDFDSLRTEIDHLHTRSSSSSSDDADAVAATNAYIQTSKVYLEVQHLLDTFDTIELLLQEAIAKKHLYDLEDAVATAAYHNIYTEQIDVAIAMIFQLSADPNALVTCIITAIRSSDSTLIESSVTDAIRGGCSDIYVTKAIVHNICSEHDRLREGDEARSSLIRTATLLERNHAAVDSHEAVTVLDRAVAVGLKSDKAMLPYMRVLERKKYTFPGYYRQEEYINNLILTSDVVQLENFLLGIGNGKLVINFPSFDVLYDWYHCLEHAAIRTNSTGTGTGTNSNHHQQQQQQQQQQMPIKTGYMLKSAKSKSESVTTRNWRKRFFVLEDGLLSYYTSSDMRVKKGYIKVTGGKIKKLSPDEAGGQSFCLQITEGRDISLTSPHLLQEVQMALHRLKCIDIKNKFYDAINKEDNDTLSVIVRHIEHFKVPIDGSDLLTAKEVLSEHTLATLIRDLRDRMHVLPRGRIEEYLDMAKALNLDSHHRYVVLANKIMASTEVEEILIRANLSVNCGDERSFIRYFTQLSSIDAHSMTYSQHRLVAHLILKHCGKKVLHSWLLGESLNELCKLLHHALSICNQLQVSTDAMQLAYMIVSINSCDNSKASGQTQTHMDTNLKLIDYLDTDKQHINIIPRSRDVLAINTAATVNGNSMGIADNHMSLSYNRFRNTPLSFLIEESAVNNSIFQLSRSVSKGSSSGSVPDATAILKSVMEGTSLKVYHYGKVKLTNNRDGLAAVILDLITEVKNSGQSHIDDVFIQLCKLIVTQPATPYAHRGWLLLSLFLHALKPSKLLSQHLSKFASTMYQHVTALVHDQAKKATPMAGEDHMEMLRIVVSKITNISNYCLKLLSWSTSDAAFYANSLINREMIDNILFVDKVYQVNIYTLSGLSVSLHVKYGEIDTPLSAFSISCTKMQHHLTSNSNSSSSSSSSEMKGGVSDSDVLHIFHGFALYDAGAIDTFHINDSPVSPNESELLPWNYDLIWNIVTRDEVRGLVLRRRVASVNEHFIDLCDIFDDFQYTDIVDNKSLWVSWLNDPINKSIPDDFIRIENLFIEDFRYANSGLYCGNDEMKVYSLAIQLFIYMNTLGDDDMNRNSQIVSSSSSGDTDDNSSSDNSKKSSSSKGDADSDDDISDSDDDSKMSVSYVIDPQATFNVGPYVVVMETEEEKREKELVNLKEKIAMLGVDCDEDLFHAIQVLMDQIDEVAANDGISKSSPKFQYFMKRAYLSYISSWPLYGYKLSQGSLIIDDDSSSSSSRHVLIGISTSGLLLLDHDSWSIVFRCNLVDIKSCHVVIEPVTLCIDVNGLKVTIEVEDANETLRYIEACSLELLGNDTLLSPASASNQYDFFSTLSSKFHAISKTESFLRDFYVLPVPPVPQLLDFADDYFEAPSANTASSSSSRAATATSTASKGTISSGRKGSDKVPKPLHKNMYQSEQNYMSSEYLHSRINVNVHGVHDDAMAMEVDHRHHHHSSTAPAATVAASKVQQKKRLSATLMSLDGNKIHFEPLGLSLLKPDADFDSDDIHVDVEGVAPHWQLDVQTFFDKAKEREETIAQALGLIDGVSAATTSHTQYYGSSESTFL